LLGILLHNHVYAIKYLVIYIFRLWKVSIILRAGTVVFFYEAKIKEIKVDQFCLGIQPNKVNLL